MTNTNRPNRTNVPDVVLRRAINFCENAIRASQTPGHRSNDAAARASADMLTSACERHGVTVDDALAAVVARIDKLV